MKYIILLSVFFSSSMALAASSGGWSFGGSLGIVNSDQSDYSTLITRANTRESGISTPQPGNAYEANAYIGYRFSGSIVSFLFRPSFFYQSVTGKNSSGGSFDYGLSGYTIFPTFRFTMLEDKSMRFFSQVGIGWGFVTGKITEGNSNVEFSGNNMGYSAGLGAEFCFFGSSHCMVVEGNVRFLGVERLVASSGTNDFGSSPDSLSQAESGKEVELDDKDLGVSLSGVQGLVGYAFRF